MILPAGANSSLTSLTSVMESEEETMKLLADTETLVAQVNNRQQHQSSTKDRYLTSFKKDHDESSDGASHQHCHHEEWIQRWIEQGNRQLDHTSQEEEDNSKEEQMILDHHHHHHHHHHKHIDQPDNKELSNSTTTDNDAVEEENEQEEIVILEDHYNNNGEKKKKKKGKNKNKNKKLEQWESIQMVRKMLNVNHKSEKNHEPSFCQCNCIINSIDEEEDCWSSREAMAEFIASNHSLWTLLSLHLGLSKTRTNQIATQVAMSMATTTTSTCYDSNNNNNKSTRNLNNNNNASSSLLHQQPLSKDQFERFQRNIIEDPNGAQEFLIRSIFATTFDYYKTFTNNSNRLSSTATKSSSSLKNEQELHDFLEILYLSSTIYEYNRGSNKSSEPGSEDLELLLPPKEELRKSLHKQIMENNNELTLEEILQQVAIHNNNNQRAAAGANKEVASRDSMISRTRILIEEEQEEEFDFCVWLDRLFFGEQREEGKRDTLCMQLSRHGRSNNNNKQGVVQENGNWSAVNLSM